VQARTRRASASGSNVRASLTCRLPPNSGCEPPSTSASKPSECQPILPQHHTTTVPPRRWLAAAGYPQAPQGVASFPFLPTSKYQAAVLPSLLCSRPPRVPHSSLTPPRVPHSSLTPPSLAFPSPLPAPLPRSLPLSRSLSRFRALARSLPTPLSLHTPLPSHSLAPFPPLFFAHYPAQVHGSFSATLLFSHRQCEVESGKERRRRGGEVEEKRRRR